MGLLFFLTLESKPRGLCSITELYPKTSSILRQVLGCCVVQSGFELFMLTLNLRFSCLCFLNAGAAWCKLHVQYGEAFVNLIMLFGATYGKENG